MWFHWQILYGTWPLRENNRILIFNRNSHFTSPILSFSWVQQHYRIYSNNLQKTRLISGKRGVCFRQSGYSTFSWLIRLKLPCAEICKPASFFCDPSGLLFYVVSCKKFLHFNYSNNSAQGLTVTWVPLSWAKRNPHVLVLIGKNTIYLSSGALIYAKTLECLNNWTRFAFFGDPKERIFPAGPYSILVFCILFNKKHFSPSKITQILNMFFDWSKHF